MTPSMVFLLASFFFGVCQVATQVGALRKKWVLFKSFPLIIILLLEFLIIPQQPYVFNNFIS